MGLKIQVPYLVFYCGNQNKDNLRGSNLVASDRKGLICHKTRRSINVSALGITEGLKTTPEEALKILFGLPEFPIGIKEEKL